MTLLAAGQEAGRGRHLPRYTRERRAEAGMLIIAVAITVFAYVLASIGKYSVMPANLVPILVAMIALMGIVHVANLFLAPHADAIIMPLVALLNGLGYVMIARLDPPQALLQGIWTAVGVTAYIVTLLVVRRAEFLDKYRYLFALLGLGLLVL
ncbi:MAG: hypothetical protein M0Z88_00460, partial [Actinomycetota bacterium]|nr:hypothetical protein [Actinomycetota bacterium]